MSPNRLLVQAGIHDRFVARLAEKVAELQVGHGLQPGVQQVGARLRGGCLSRPSLLLAACGWIKCTAGVWAVCRVAPACGCCC